MAGTSPAGVCCPPPAHAGAMQRKTTVLTFYPRGQQAAAYTRELTRAGSLSLNSPAQGFDSVLDILLSLSDRLYTASFSPSSVQSPASSGHPWASHLAEH